jgi:hypothetical protein
MKHIFWKGSKPQDNRLILIREKTKSFTFVHIGWYDSASNTWFCLSNESVSGEKLKHGNFTSISITNIDGWMDLKQLA